VRAKTSTVRRGGVDVQALVVDTTGLIVDGDAHVTVKKIKFTGAISVSDSTFRDNQTDSCYVSKVLLTVIAECPNPLFPPFRKGD